MSDLLGISSSAVTTYQRALGVVSNNIANAATEGYTRQDVSLESSPTQSNGKVYLGTGVLFNAVKRQYDAFVEANLRNSKSDLESQKPMVDYTNRVVDVMGGATSGLGSALDQFFSSARSLAADPASTVLRSSFLRDASGLASRFNQLSAQLDLVDNETRDAVQSNVTQMNALAAQLSSVNQQLGKYRELTRQPPELLDQRDQLLQQLAQFTKLRTQFAENGEVTVSLGASITQEVFVSGKNFTRLSASFDAASPERVSLVLDPYGDPRPLTGISSGELAGLISFREQVLGSTRGMLDSLARTLAREVNAIHSQGVDAAGLRGAELFAFDPALGTSSAGLYVAVTDPLKVSAASAFRVIENANNPGSEDATVRYAPPQYEGPAALDQVLGNNGNLAAARSLNVSATPGVAALSTLTAGMTDVTVFLDTLSPGQHLQMLTRDGRHLAGQTLSADLQDRLLVSGNGFEPGATYSTQYLNSEGENSYRNMGVFYGARAAAQRLQQFDSQGNAIDPTLRKAMVTGDSVSTGFAGLSGGDQVRLNGVSLGSLSPSNGVSIQASDVAAWFTAANVDGVFASASTEVRVPAGQLQLDLTLTLNGVDISRPEGGYSSAQSLIHAINAQKDQTGVQASFNSQGALVLSNATGQDIEVGSHGGQAPNVLGIGNGSYTGRVRLERSQADLGGIELSLGALGNAGTLGKLGLNTGVTFAPQVQSPVLQGSSMAANWSGLGTGDHFSLNGQRLGALLPDNGNLSVQAYNVASWLNAAGADGVRATANNEIRVAPSQLRLRESLILNGVTVTTGNLDSVNALADAINASGSGVSASISTQGELVLNNGTGEDILIAGLTGNAPNALGLAGGRYSGQVKLERTDGSTDPIELAIGPDGDPDTLGKLGFRTQLHIEGAMPEDALVFVTGAGQAKLAATYSGTPSDDIDRLRATPMSLVFTSATRYQITDKQTGTLLAERDYNPNDPDASIQYQGLSIRFSKPPQAGDQFTIDGNQDGTGDNQAMLDLVDLERRNAVGSKTIGAAYIDHVNDIGNVARQAKIVQSSLQVVHDQAASSRDQVSGVSLDEEAANLIRFQQAYQASAKVLQVASQLFDTMLQIQ